MHSFTSPELRTHTEFLAGLSRELRSPGTHTTDAFFPVHDPASGTEIAQVVDAEEHLAEHFLSTAVAGHQGWERESPRHRSNVLLRAAELLLEREETLAQTISREMGKPLPESRAEVRFSADYFRWFSEEAVRSQGSYREAPGGGAKLVLTRKAIGVSLLITPWNFPLAMGARKAAAALAAGCSVILKPAELTPLSSLLLADVLHESGVPGNAFQVLTTTRSAAWSARLMADPRLRKVSFTGSTRVGSVLIRQSATHIQKLSLELGGDAPFIVFDDADLSRAVGAAMIAKTRNGGQACVAANRFFVQEGIRDEFIAALHDRLAEITIGHGFDPTVTMGPLISQNAKDATVRLVDEALDQGATAHISAGSPAASGLFVSPQLLTDVPESAEIRRAEIFAPIAMVHSFRTAQEAISEANDSPYGLAGYVFSQDIDQAMSAADALASGVVGINKGLVADASSPFGGTGYSGYGKEGGIEGMQDFQTLRQFNIDAPAARWDHS